MDSRVSTAGNIASLKLLRSYPLRAGIIWLAIHVFVAASAGAPGSVGFSATIVLALIAGVVVILDARRRREIGFLQNLGVNASLPPVLAIATVLILEIILSSVT